MIKLYTRAIHFAPKKSQVFGANSVPWDVSNKTMSFFSHKNAFLASAQEIKFRKYETKIKTKVSILLWFWGFIRVALMRGFQIWSQN